MDTSHDLPNLVTHDEILYCPYCEKDTVHRVGIHLDYYETDRYIMDKSTEYVHCECGNTGSIVQKEITMKDVDA